MACLGVEKSIKSFINFDFSDDFHNFCEAFIYFKIG